MTSTRLPELGEGELWATAIIQRYSPDEEIVDLLYLYEPSSGGDELAHGSCTLGTHSVLEKDGMLADPTKHRAGNLVLLLVNGNLEPIQLILEPPFDEVAAQEQASKASANGSTPRLGLDDTW